MPQGLLPSVNPSPLGANTERRRGTHRGAIVAAALGLPLLVAGCGAPGPAIPVWDNAFDVMHCKHVARVSPNVATEGGFDETLERMTTKTVAVGGTDLFLRKKSRDWSHVVGEAYRCRGPARTRRPVLSVKY